MTHSDLDAKIARQAESLVPWVKRAYDRIDGRFADALSHARNAVTDTLKRTPDGRPTIRKAVLSPSYNGAMTRLDELWAWLAGPSVASLSGLIRDAREAFYRDAFREWKPFIPDQFFVAPDPKPTAEGIRQIRASVLHGFDLRTEIGGPILSAQRSLRAAIAVAGQRAATTRDSSYVLVAWRLKAQNAVLGSVRRALSDSQIHADVQAGRDLVHPDYLDDRPPTVD